jgi:hypothetical protein
MDHVELNDDILHSFQEDREDFVKLSGGLNGYG